MDISLLSVLSPKAPPAASSGADTDDGASDAPLAAFTNLISVSLGALEKDSANSGDRISPELTGVVSPQILSAAKAANQDPSDESIISAVMAELAAESKSDAPIEPIRDQGTQTPLALMPESIVTSLQQNPIIVNQPLQSLVRAGDAVADIKSGQSGQSDQSDQSDVLDVAVVTVPVADVTVIAKNTENTVTDELPAELVASNTPSKQTQESKTDGLVSNLPLNALDKTIVDEADVSAKPAIVATKNAQTSVEAISVQAQQEAPLVEASLDLKLEDVSASKKNNDVLSADSGDKTVVSDKDIQEPQAAYVPILLQLVNVPQTSPQEMTNEAAVLDVKPAIKPSELLAPAKPSLTKPNMLQGVGEPEMFGSADGTIENLEALVERILSQHSASKSQENFDQLLQENSAASTPATHSLASTGMQAAAVMTPHTPSDKPVSDFNERPLVVYQSDKPAMSDQVHVSIRKAMGDGADRMMIQLDPQSLGKVEVRMEMSNGVASHIVFTAEHKATLDALQQDASYLQKALEDSGIKADAGAMEFNLKQNQTFQQNESGTESAREEILPPIVAADSEVKSSDGLTSHYMVQVSDGIDIKV